MQIPRSAALVFSLVGALVSAIAGCSSEDTASSDVVESGHVADTPAAETPATPEKKPVGRGTPLPYHGDLPTLAALNIRNARLEKVLQGLDRPWAFEFVNDQEILLTELPGRISRYRLDSGELTEITGLPDIATSRVQTGLLDIEIHPAYTDNGRIYFSYAVSDGNENPFFLTEVATAIISGNALTDLQVIVRAEPFGWSPSNFGGALEFDQQGYLYISIGDRSNGNDAQMGNLLQGKILRLHDDGSVPDDNPFINAPDVDDRIYALGVRNPQGLHFDVASGLLFESEHGPMGGDEVNIIRAGANYGWPLITYGKDYTSAGIGSGTHRQDMAQPVFYYLPSAAISPITVYRGEMFAEWTGDLLLGALRGQHVSKLDWDDGVVRSEYPVLSELDARIRDIKVAADGSIFILTQPGDLYRLYRDPDDVIAVADNTDKFYKGVCAACHDAGVGGAPRIGVPDDWAQIIQQPVETIYLHALEGYGSMPERGLCYFCTDEKIRLLVDYMLEQSAGDD